ncbi:MAG: hypothetical protein J6B07_01290, partial [Opitutales bacterium]|nr:hypothetical protein [Opitutales bacterium]
VGDWSKIIDYGKEVMVDIAKSSTSAFDFVTALVSTQLQGNPKVKTKSIIGYDNFVQLFANVGIECTIAKTTFVNARGASIMYNRLLSANMANKLLSHIGRNTSDIIRSQLRLFATKDKKQILTALVSADTINTGNALASQITDIVKELDISPKPTKPKKQKPNKATLIANDINDLVHDGNLDALNSQLQQLGLKIVPCTVDEVKDEQVKKNESSSTNIPKEDDTKDVEPPSTKVDDSLLNIQLTEVMQLLASNDANAVRSKVAKFVSSLLTLTERMQYNGLQNKIAWSVTKNKVDLKLLYSQRSLDDLKSAFPDFFSE